MRREGLVSAPGCPSSERRRTDSVNKLSKVSADAPFVSDRDTQFARLLNMSVFWWVMLEQYELPPSLTERTCWKLCELLASEGSIMFDLRFRRGFSVEQIVLSDREGVWTPEIVERFLSLLQEARELWEKGELVLPYQPRMQALLAKARRGEALTERERLVLCKNAMSRYGFGVSVDPSQARIYRQELGGLSGDALREKRRQMLLDSTWID